MNVLLPIETINREIDFKLVLAAQLANKGYRIYIGQHDFLMELLPRLKGGLYIGKNIFKKRADKENGESYKLLKKHDFNIVYLHEEGAVFSGKEKEWQQTLCSQYNIDFFDKNDVVCTWGDFQKRLDQSRSHYGVQIFTTGHPRFDLYKPEWHFIFKDSTDKLKAQFGDFILINGNFGLANHGKGLNYVFSDIGNYVVGEEVGRLNRVGIFAHTTKQMVSMVELTHQLAAKFPDKTFVYRPHPSESDQYYQIIFNGVENIIVDHSGSVNAWILASQAVIHDGCTTAIEATLAGKNVINYKATKDSIYDVWLPKQMGIKAESLEEVIQCLRQNGNQEGKLCVDSRVSQLMYNFEGNSFEAFNQVLDDGFKNINDKQFNNKLTTQYIAKIYWKKKVKTNVLAFHPTKRKDLYYHQKKFKGFNVFNIKDKIALLEKNLNKPIRFTLFNPYLIEIQ